MSNDIVLFEKIDELEAKVKELEQEIEIKEDAHCQELRLMHEHIKTFMHKHCIE